MSSSSPARGGRAPSSSSDPQTSPRRGGDVPDDDEEEELGEDLEENMLEYAPSCVSRQWVVVARLCSRSLRYRAFATIAITP